MMMMNVGGRTCRYPFTATQWQELEHQALVFKYMVSGVPIPPDLLYTIRRSLDSSVSAKFLISQPQSIGWNSFQMGFGRKIDPEPGRCRRTDGKKWRCSKEAYPDSKYCERHMHRGRNRSRKPVEILSSPPTPAATVQPPNAIPIPITNTNTPSITNNKTTLLHYAPSSNASSETPYFLSTPHFPSRSPGTGLSSQESTTNFFLESYSAAAHHHHSPGKGAACRNGSSDSCGAWKLAPLTKGSSSPYQIKHNNPDLQHKNAHHFYTSHDIQPPDMDDHQPKKVMHHFLDEWPPKDHKDSWPNNPDDKIATHRTQLSISIPNSLHDFFITQNEKM